MTLPTFFNAGSPGPAGPVGPAGPAGPAGPSSGGGLGSSGGVNPYFDCWDSNGPAAQIVPQRGYAATGWTQETENGAADTVQRDQALVFGTNALNKFRMNKGGAAGKMMVVQWLPESDSYAWQGLVAAIIGDLECNDGLGAPVDLRMALLQSTNPPNNVAGPMVTAWNGAGVDPTFDPSISVVGAITVTPGAGVMGTFVAGIGAPVGGFGNLGFGFFTDDPVPAGGYLRLSRCYMQPGGTTSYPNKPSGSVARQMCEGFVEKSYPPDVPPGTITPAGQMILPGGGTTAFKHRVGKLYDVFGFPPPTGNPNLGAQVYSPVTGLPNFAWDPVLAGDVPVVVNRCDQNSIEITNAGAPGSAVQAHIVVNAGM